MSLVWCDWQLVISATGCSEIVLGGCHMCLRLLEPLYIEIQVYKLRGKLLEYKRDLVAISL